MTPNNTPTSEEMAREIAQKYFPLSDDDVQNQAGIFLSIDIQKVLDAKRKEVALEIMNGLNAFLHPYKYYEHTWLLSNLEQVTVDKEKTIAYTSTMAFSSDVERRLDSLAQASSKTSLISHSDILFVPTGVFPLDGEAQFFQAVDSPQGCSRFLLTPFHALSVRLDMPYLMEKGKEARITISPLPFAYSTASVDVSMGSFPTGRIVYNINAPFEYFRICYLGVARHVSSVLKSSLFLYYSSIIPKWTELTFEFSGKLTSNHWTYDSISTFFVRNTVFE